MHGDPFADADAESGDFALFDPDAGESFFARSGDVEVGEGADEGFFEIAEVGVEVFSSGGEVEDGVADELSRAVVGGLTATVDFDDRVRELCGVAKGGLIADASDGVNGGVL